MIHTIKIYATQVTLKELREFVAEADALGALDEQVVRISQARETGYQLDPGGEITVEISVGAASL